MARMLTLCAKFSTLFNLLIVVAFCILGNVEKSFAFVPSGIEKNFRKKHLPFQIGARFVIRGIPKTANAACLSSEANEVVGVVGRGYVPVLTAKLASLSGYKTWIITPEGEEERIKSLIFDDTNIEAVRSRIEFVASRDQAMAEEKLAQTKALILAVDGDGVLTPEVLGFLLNPSLCTQLNRVVAMSRNLNGKGLGFFSKASKKTANPEVWAGDKQLIAQYRQFESDVKSKAGACGSEFTIVRAGTLKGGGCGDEGSYGGDKDSTSSYYPQYLTSKYYEYTKRDMVTWQLLFDCSIRGVTLSRGDTVVGPGPKAVLTANSPDECQGDTSRCGIAEAMVRSLQVAEAGNVDFAVGTIASRKPPSDVEWKELFRSSLA